MASEKTARKDIPFEDKIINFCVYRERCIQEVLTKMKELGVTENKKNKILNKLIDNNYVNEERYVRSFVNGKFRNNKWGKYKIKNMLYAKGIDDVLINESLKLIPEDEYIETLQTLIKKKVLEVKEPDNYIKKQKVLAYITRKGFESQLSIEIIETLEVN